MIDKKLNKRQEIILAKIKLNETYAIGDLLLLFSNSDIPSLATLRRDLKELSISGFLKQIGKLKNTRYELTVLGIIYNPINAHDYCAIDLDKRNGGTQYNFSLFEKFPENIFSKEEIIKFTEATKLFKDKSQNASRTIQQKELERFVIELSWKSSKIEGNTYSLLDTELLLKEGIKAPGHTESEVTMILNHKKAFQYILSFKEKYKNPNIRLIEDVHRLLTEGLGVSFGLRSKPVGVTGSVYVPLSIPTQIDEALRDLCKAIEKLETPYEKALLALLGISYIQPFEDGNKRTARLFANAILLAYDSAPLSYRNVDEINFKESILVFYEKNSIISMQKIFIDQYLFACKNYLQF
ncbi:MAG: Fic family protein [Candidatus Paceibacterota bacterium]